MNMNRRNALQAYAHRKAANTVLHCMLATLYYTVELLLLPNRVQYTAPDGCCLLRRYTQLAALTARYTSRAGLCSTATASRTHAIGCSSSVAVDKCRLDCNAQVLSKAPTQGMQILVAIHLPRVLGQVPSPQLNMHYT
jgi:hypothetical protein